MPEHLQLHATPAGLCLDVRGRLDAETRGNLTRALTAIFDHLPARRVVLGLYRTTAIDRAGVTALITARAQARRRGVDLLVCGPQDHVRAAIAALGATDLLADGADAPSRHLPVGLRRRPVRVGVGGCPRPPRPRRSQQHYVRPAR